MCRSTRTADGGNLFCIMILLWGQDSYINKEKKFQYIPAYSRMDRTTFPGHLSIAINMLSSNYFAAFGAVCSSYS